MERVSATMSRECGKSFPCRDIDDTNPFVGGMPPSLQDTLRRQLGFRGKDHLTRNSRRKGLEKIDLVRADDRLPEDDPPQPRRQSAAHDRTTSARVPELMTRPCSRR